MTEIGPTLREARMRARIDITEVERATKIRTKYLRALEDEEWGVLPGNTFARSFLRTYAEYLGLDARLLVEEFKRRYDRPAEVELAPRAPAARRRGGARREGRPPGGGRGREGLVVVAVLALVLAGLFALGKLGGGGDDSPGVSAQTQTQTTKRKAPAKRRRAPAAPGRARVELTPTGPVYVCAVDGTGRKLVAGLTLSPGAPRVLRGRRILLTLGNASVRMKVNGRAAPVPASSRPISYLVTPAGRRVLPAARAPSCA